MKRRARIPLLATGAAVLIGAALMGSPAQAGAPTQRSAAQQDWDPVCVSHSSLCADAIDLPAEDGYVGHDEPSLEFKSTTPGSGNDMTYVMTLPRDPADQPSASGAGATWNFQLRPTFWFGLTLCDTQSSPEYTQTCTPDSDSNNLVNTDPNAPDYIGKHPGNAYMELQFDGPGYVPQFEGFGCTATQYCAVMTIDSRTRDQNTSTENNRDCNNYILGGPEPINWAWVTTSGVSQAPANPLFTGTFSNPNFSAVNPDPSKDLMMNPGDRIRIHMHDTEAGFRVDLTDLTTGGTGSMTASIANGFGHIMFEPTSSTCHAQPYAFHPEYSTASTLGNTWSVHTYNVAMSDEIGHFENCLKLDAEFNCAHPGKQDSGGLDEDDGNNFCVPGSDSTLVHINGCFSSDEDFDGQSYQLDWPGTDPNPARDAALHPSPLLFTSPTFGAGQNYSTIAFETDLPRLEASDSQDNPPFCNLVTGTNCFDPPVGAAFYPFFSTRMNSGTCTWQEGGPYIPGTVNNFGGSAHAEFGPLLQTYFPTGPSASNPSPHVIFRYENFNSGDLANPCQVSGG